MVVEGLTHARERGKTPYLEQNAPRASNISRYTLVPEMMVMSCSF
jgi:hypothetical protein